MVLDKRAWRFQKGHGAQEKGHGAAPCYFALDLTLVNTLQFLYKKTVLTQASKWAAKMMLEIFWIAYLYWIYYYTWIKGQHPFLITYLLINVNDITVYEKYLLKTN